MEAACILKGREAFLLRQHEAARAVAYEAAVLTAHAYHDPKNIPRYAPLSQDGPADDDPRRRAREAAEVRGRLTAMARVSARGARS
ncbi:hypothetical protein [Jannaschia sp. M317]|uniref:hypothetical protein n=1 Tax=Jannaschia sp. M317 TaxID=2867011 RepID=UPI0021A4635E|nr:hypothetical protein [Jannaschia sp. M317]UWQ16157.1 hypothetical protein K3551_09420 [Jannaschia sp. M317]